MRIIFGLILYYLLLIQPTSVAQDFYCRSPTINNSCNAQDVDQSGPTGQLLSTQALNPIDLYSGNKYLRDVDLYAHPATPDLEIVRHYNSMDSGYRSLSAAWRLSYDAQLQITAHHTTLQHANGTLRLLEANAGHLEKTLDRFIWRFHNGDVWHFNLAGWLIRLHRHQQAPLDIQRHLSGPLQHQIQSVQQNTTTLQFIYESLGSAPPLLQQIHSPVGTIHYEYTALAESALPQLTQVNYPDQRRLIYHYEAHYQSQHSRAITGKSIQLAAKAPQLRVRSWVYDAEGRAIFSMAENPHQWVRLSYPNLAHPLQTRLQSPQGLTFINFLTAQPTPEIQSVRGVSCWACPPTFERQPEQIKFENLHLHHDSQQRIQQLKVQLTGWPDLQLRYNKQGQLIEWQNAWQQPTKLYYQQNRAQSMHFANGDQHTLHYDAQHRIHTIDYQSTTARQQTHIRYPSPRQLHISNDNETEQLTFNDNKQLTERHVQRRLNTPLAQVQWHYKEQFHYDEKQRLIRHDLPEGGALIYQWQQHHLHRIDWQNREGQKLTVVQAEPTTRHYFNGLTQHTSKKGNTYQRHVLSSTQSWWQQKLQLTQGLVTRNEQHYAIIDPPLHQATNYAYNQQKQLIIEKKVAQKPDFYAWRPSGALAATSHHPTAQFTLDKSGLAQSWENTQQRYILGFNAMRRLDVVYENKNTVQKNSHNAYGFRVYAQHYPQAKQQFFLYHNKRIVAEYSTDFVSKLPIHATHPISRRYIYYQHTPIALIDYQLKSLGEPLVIHSDHLGAAHLLSDQQQRLRWAATYDTFGRANQVAGDLDFHLRREGQYYDLATGWHDNLLRTYLPQQGHYLEPDPLGPSPVTQLVGYSKQQPLNHTDPWGLLLFAFDGTRYDQSSGGVVHSLQQAAVEPSFYSAGPGNPNQIDWDAMVAYSTEQIAQQQWQNLLNHLRYMQENAPTTTIPIDIIGFSRGAAIALHFANQIMSHTQNGLFSYTDSYGSQIRACIQPRFIGLLDTVAQMGLMGAKNYLYDFTVAPAWQWVSHAVALHEYRLLFPLHSIGQQANSQEVGFIGAHSDLGGGYTTAEQGGMSALSEVALQWMLWQAQAQGMTFNHVEKNTTGYAYLHDESSPLELDRRVENHRFPFNLDSDVRNKQSLHPIYGLQARQAVQPLLDFSLDPEEKINNRIAKVDLHAYYQWLAQTQRWPLD